MSNSSLLANIPTELPPRIPCQHPDRGPQIIVKRASALASAPVVFAAALTMVAIATLAGLFLQEYFSDTSYRAWLLFACVPPISYAARRLFDHLALVWQHRGTLEVVLDSITSRTLFDAVLSSIEEVAETKDETASTCVDAYTEYDKSHGRTQVRMRLSGRVPHTLQLNLADGHHLTATFSKGASVICGRDHALTAQETLVLRLSRTRNLSVDKKLMQDWLLACVERYRRPSSDTVEVIALDQSSSDWIPEWRTRCVRSTKHFNGVGNNFFLPRQSMSQVMADACLWSSRALRIYLVLGPPGTGKTELTIWLAGYLRVPLYRLSLNDSRLSDQVFAQLVSPTSLQHDNAVIQIDEFQDTLRRWQQNGSEAGVSMGGFCEVLQGSNSLTRGFIVLSGTQDLKETMKDPTFGAVFRRISIPPVVLTWLENTDIAMFAQRFIADFLPDVPAQELDALGKAFVSEASPWSSGRITIDMVKRFLMQRISMFWALDPAPSGQPLEPGSRITIPTAKRQGFFTYLCDTTAARKHLELWQQTMASHA